MISVFFFFSSRRRHTRWNCDWSSDVCSSDLSGAAGASRAAWAAWAVACSALSLTGAARELGGPARVAAARSGLLLALLARLLARRPPGAAQAGHRRHAGDAAAEHGLHLLLALEEVRDQLGDLADGDP